MDTLATIEQPVEVAEEAVSVTDPNPSTDEAASAEPAHSADEVQPSVTTEEPTAEASGVTDLEPPVEDLETTGEVQAVAQPTEELAPQPREEEAEPIEGPVETPAAEEAAAAEQPAAESEAVAERAEPAEEELEPEPTSMADLVEGIEFTPLKAGEIRDGTVVSVSADEILVDVGAKSEGYIHPREMERHGKEYVKTLKVGDPVVVYVVRPEDRDGNVVLSLSRAQQERDWREAERLLESGEIFQSTVIGYNRGGVICRLGKVRGFVPASQIVSKPEETEEKSGEEDRWAGLVGKELWLKVIELDRRRNRLILSERLAQRELRRRRKEQLLSELKKGDVRKGRVSSIAKFGAFVDLGGADGLVHLSELSWAKVSHPSEVVKVGQEVEVYVLNVDRQRKRIGLSMRRLEPEPWSVVHERYAVGQLVEGVITKLASFGAFARIDGVIEGLIHISELANHRVTHPREVVKEGQKVTLRIIRIDPARRRMGLSLKRVAEEEYAELDWREGYPDETEELDEDFEDVFEEELISDLDLEAKEPVNDEVEQEESTEQ